MSPSDEGLNQGRKRKRKQKTKNRKAKAKAVAEDRISCLSDEILHRVMSFMNTKYAVQTCVLSKRWKSLWKSLPYLNFSLETFPFKGDRKEDQEKEDPKINSLEDFITHSEKEVPKMISFENFTTQVIFRRHHTDLVKVCFQTLDKTCLLRRHVYTFCAFALEGLIAYVVDHNVQQLTIQSQCHKAFVLPENFHICQSLETFNGHVAPIISPKFLALPALKSLHLWGLEITKNWFDPRNLSGCPNLESLELSDLHCAWRYKPLDTALDSPNPRDLPIFSNLESLKVFDLQDKTLFVNAPKLKRLELSFRPSCKEVGCKVVIDAPGLMTFQYHGFYPIVSSSFDLASIDDVCFDIYNGYIAEVDPVIVEKDVDVNHEHVLGLVNTFKAFRHAKSITLPLETVQLKQESSQKEFVKPSTNPFCV